MIRIAKILLVIAVAFLGAQGIFNFTGWETGQAMVRTITSMSGMDENLRAPWASANPVLVNLGIFTIAAGKLLGGIFCGLGAWQMWAARAGSPDDFQASKQWAVVGCSVLMLLFFGAFMYVSGQFFMGWRTEIGQGSIQGAFQLGGSIALILLFINQRDE